MSLSHIPMNLSKDFITITNQTQIRHPLELLLSSCSC